MKFKAGDRVLVNNAVSNPASLKGKTGVVVGLEVPSANIWRVSLDVPNVPYPQGFALLFSSEIDLYNGMDEVFKWLEDNA